MPEGVTATKISCKDFIDILKGRIWFQWKLEFEKEGFHLRSAMLKEFLDMWVHLEEAEMHTPLVKKIACAKKEHGEDGKGKLHGKSELRHEMHHGLGKYHAGK
eukprot:3188016-Ditylum_brightwellii.AAC.1